VSEGRVPNKTISLSLLTVLCLSLPTGAVLGEHTDGQVRPVPHYSVSKGASIPTGMSVSVIIAPQHLSYLFVCHLTSSYLILSYLILSYLILSYRTLSVLNLFLSYHRRIIALLPPLPRIFHISSHQITSHLLVSHFLTLHLVLPCPVLSCPVLSCHTIVPSGPRSRRRVGVTYPSTDSQTRTSSAMRGSDSPPLLGRQVRIAALSSFCLTKCT
jgi:hypothetical protein